MQSTAINVQTLEKVADYLVDRVSVSDEEIKSRQNAMLSYRSRFMFKRVGVESEPDAIATIIDIVCQVA